MTTPNTPIIDTITCISTMSSRQCLMAKIREKPLCNSKIFDSTPVVGLPEICLSQGNSKNVFCIKHLSKRKYPEEMSTESCCTICKSQPIFIDADVHKKANYTRFILETSDEGFIKSKLSIMYQ